MKKILLNCFLLSAITLTVNAQLADTKWKNLMNIPDPYETFLQFKKDTVMINLVSDGTLIETMNFKVSKDTLRITKLSGMSPCTEDIIGVYRFEIKEEKLTITAITDDCPERANAFRPEAWTKEKI
jgi:hypothetical protein